MVSAAFCASRIVVAATRSIARIDEDGNTNSLGCKLMQELQSLGHYLIREKINASRIAARPSKASDKTKLDGVFSNAEDDRDPCCRGFGRKRRCSAGRGDHCNLSADQIGHQRREAIVLTIQIVVLDRYVLTFDVAGLVEAFAKRGRIACVRIGRPVSDKPNHRERWLLRAYGLRQRCRATDQHDELASPHGLAS